MFGRGGEEIQTLQQHHVPFQVVPGITAQRAASYAGSAHYEITHGSLPPVTYKKIIFISTGQRWHNSINLGVLIGLTGLSVLCKAVKHGIPQEMPVPCAVGHV